MHDGAENGISLDLNDSVEQKSSDEEEIEEEEEESRREEIQRAFREDENRRNALLMVENATRVIEAMCGVVKSKRSIWRLKTITNFFWVIVNIMGVFFATLFSMEKSEAYREGSGSAKKWDGGSSGGPGGGGSGGPRGPPRRGLDNVRRLDSIRGLNPSSLPACGSCCG